MRALISASRLLWRSSAGASAIEFAFIAPLFLAIAFSAFEGGWIMTQRMMLGRAMDKTIRLMRVGATNAPTTQEQMKQAVCDAAVVIHDCMNVITLEMTQIKTASDFPTTDATCVDRTKKIQPTVSFTPGSRSSIMYVRACIVTDPLTPGLGLGLALPKDLSGGFRLIAVGAFMNEPSS